MEVLIVFAGLTVLFLLGLPAYLREKRRNERQEREHREWLDGEIRAAHDRRRKIYGR
jgi:hypothetical protein